MAGVVWVNWYATLFNQDSFAAAVSEAAPIAMRYGATKYAVSQSRDDRYKITQMAWFESKTQWYRYWDGPEMIAFRSRYSRRYQIPVSYIWHDELVAGEIGPGVANGNGAPQPQPQPAPEHTRA